MKTAIVTGAYGAIGKSIARKLAESGFKTCLAGRDEKKLKDAAEEIIHSSGNRNVFYEVVDLSSSQQISAFAARWKEPLSVLVNNAAVAPRKRLENKEGVEMQFAVNVLAYFRMINSFLAFLKEGRDPRIVNVASYWAGGLELSDLEFKRRGYDNDDAYRQSKQADRMLTVAFAGLLMPAGISVNACHPGDVNSKLSNDLGFGGGDLPDEGSATPVWLATAPEIKGITGRYFAHRKEAFCEFAAGKDAINELFRICSSYE